jgi:hypothetical protein
MGADAQMRKRDERFATQEQHKAGPDPLHDKSAAAKEQPARLFGPSDFIVVDWRMLACTWQPQVAA